MSAGKLTRRQFLKASAAAGTGLCASSLVGCSRRPAPAQLSERVVILGFDGMEPSFVSKWMAEGKLPNMSRLAARGGFHKLATSNPPESPVAWASFVTSSNPGKHGIYDFLRRDPETYFPDIVAPDQVPPKFLLKLIPVRRPKLVRTRGGTSFWKHADDARIESTIFQVPASFPPDELTYGRQLSGLGIPDIRGTQGTFFYFATDLSELEVGNTEFGGKLVKLKLIGDMAKSEIEGPKNPLAKKFSRISTPVSFKLDRGAHKVTISACGRTQTVPERSWSDWFTVTFQVTPLAKIHSIGKFYVLQTSPALRIYLMPLSWDPRSPAVPISNPADFAERLAKANGLYKTLGWAIDTWALTEQRIDEEVFLHDVYETLGQREKNVLYLLQKHPGNLFAAVFSATDRVQHTFWRFIDPASPRYDDYLAKKYAGAIEELYRRCDDIVGKVMESCGEKASVFIVSDHGFHPFRKGFNVNTWLVRNGFMTFLGTEGEKTYNLDDLFSQGDFFPDVDFSRTRAYALGLGQIYINLEGREKFGCVSPGQDYEETVAAIINGLRKVTDPETGEPVVFNAYPRKQIYHGPFFDQAPDIQIGFRSGYRVSWQSTLGAIPRELVSPNRKIWSGDHCSLEQSITHGVLLSSLRISSPSPSIMDIGPTALKLLGVPIPEDFDGEPLVVSGAAARRGA